MPRVAFLNLPKELKGVISESDYNIMHASDPGLDILIPYGDARVAVHMPSLLHRLTENENPLTHTSYQFIGNIKRFLESSEAEFNLWLREKNSLMGGWAPSNRYYTVSFSTIPSATSYFRKWSEKKNHQVSAWHNFRFGHEEPTNFGKINLDLFQQVKQAFANRPALESHYAQKRQIQIEQEAQKQRELQRKAQEEAAKASYDKALAFKTEEFNQAIASQNATHQQEYNALKQQFEITSSGNAQNIAHLSKQLEETNNLFRKQTDEFSAFKISQKQQADNYERQLQARAKDEQAKKEEALILRQNLRRRITLSETAGANFHFVNLNTKSDQSSGVTAFINGGGRYVGSKARYTPKGRLRLNNTLSGTQTPDLYLSMFREKGKK